MSTNVGFCIFQGCIGGAWDAPLQLGEDGGVARVCRHHSSVLRESQTQTIAYLAYNCMCLHVTRNETQSIICILHSVISYSIVNPYLLKGAAVA